MEKIEAQKVVRKYLGDSDKKKFDALVEETKDPNIAMDKLMEASEKLTELFDRNNIQIVAQPIGDGCLKMDLFVLHKGDIVE